MSYKVVSNHAEDLADGRVVQPGEIVSKVDLKEERNKRLIELGRLVELPKKDTAKKQSGDDGKGGTD